MNRAILETTPPVPHELNPRVPPALSELCMGMLEKDPEARYPDAKALAEALLEQCTQADSTWRTPLFPGARRDKHPAPAPAVPVRRVARGWWVAGLVLAAVLVGSGVVSLFAAWRRQPSTELTLDQRAESPYPAPPQQAILRQEVAPAGLTGEVGSGAAPEKSSTPAPAAKAANREEPSMTKSKTTRALLAAGCVASSACVSGPQHRQPPKPAECPPGAQETLKRFNIGTRGERIIIPPFDTDYSEVELSEGPVIGEILPPWGKLPARTRIHGELFFAKGHVYGRFTRARLPDGEFVPVCLEMLTSQGLGIAMEPGSTSEKARVSNIMSVQPETRFH